MVAEGGPFVAVTGVRGLEQDIAGARLHQGGQHLGHIDVADMRAFVVSPADMYAQMVLRQPRQRIVQRLDMQFGDADEGIVVEIGKQHVARQGEVGAVDLQVEARFEDRAILVAHGGGEGREIPLARGVEIVRQEERDDAGRGRVHEAACDSVLFHCGLEIVDILIQFVLPAGADGAGASGAGVFRCAALPGEAVEEGGEQLEVGGGVPGLSPSNPV